MEGYNDTFLLVGKVRRSYAIKEIPLRPWVAIRKDNVVEYGHCTCMAGLAETCSHVAAILYRLKTAVCIHQEAIGTSKLSSWLPSSQVSSDVPYMAVEKLEDVAPERMHSHEARKRRAAETPNDEELQEFYFHLNKDSS